MSAPHGHLSQETLDLLQLEGLDAAKAADAQQHLGGCASCQGRFAELQKDAQHFEQFVFARSLPKVEAKLEKRPLFAFAGARWLVPALGLASAAALVAVFSVTGGGTETEDEVYIGVKGMEPPGLAVVALRGGSQRFEVRKGSTMKPGDKLRFVVNPGKDQYVMIASRDGAGAFTVYYPFNGQTSAPVSGLPGGNRLELPGAVELDDTLGEERLVAIFSEKPVQASDVDAALRASPSDPKVSGARAVLLTFTKAAK